MEQDITDCLEDEIWDGSERVCVKEDYRNKIGDGEIPNRYYVMFSNAEHICKEREDGGMYCDWDDSKEPAGDVIAVFDSYHDAVDWAETFKNMEDEITIKGKTFEITSITIEDRLVGEVWEKGTYNYTRTTQEREFETHTMLGYLREALEQRGVTLR